MARVLLIVLLLLGVSASAAHASVFVSTTVDDDGNARLRVDARSVEEVDLRVERGWSGFPVVVDAGEVPVEVTDGSCQTVGTVVNCWNMDVDVLLGDGDDRLSLAWVWADVHAGDGDDEVRSLLTTGTFDGGRGRDALELPGDGLGVTLIANAWGTARRGFERLTTSPDGDYVEVDPGVDTDLADGDDIVIAQDRVAEVVTCGPGTDTAYVDPEDRALGCETVWVSGSPAPSPAPPPSRSPRPQEPSQAGISFENLLGLASPPKVEGEQVSFSVRAFFADESAADIRVGPWRGDQAPVTLPTVAGIRSGAHDMGFTFRVPPDLLEAGRRDGRLRVQGALTLRNADGAVTRLGGFTIVLPRRSRVVLDGRRLRGTFGIQRLVGGARGDRLAGESANDALLGLGGTDELHGGTGNDRLSGGVGDDLLDGGDGDDVVLGGAGDDDLIEARFGNDRLDGGDGDDVIHGRRGTDIIAGGAGDDVIDGGSGLDRIDCGPGEDVVLVSYTNEQATNCEQKLAGENVVLRRCLLGATDGPETVMGTEGDDRCSGLAGDDDLEGRGGDDHLDAGPGNDRLFGRFGVDVLLGGEGNDELEGGRGRDALDGGPGDDQLNGGYHRDRVSGGPGADRVIARGGGTDRIDCGPGRDVAYVDSRDVTRGCERVHRSGSRTRRR